MNFKGLLLLHLRRYLSHCFGSLYINRTCCCRRQLHEWTHVEREKKKDGTYECGSPPDKSCGVCAPAPFWICLYILCIYTLGAIRFIILLKRRPALNCFDFVFNVNQRATGPQFEFRLNKCELEIYLPLPSTPLDRARRHFYMRASQYKNAQPAGRIGFISLADTPNENGEWKKYALISDCFLCSFNWLGALHCSNSLALQKLFRNAHFLCAFF